MSADGDQERHPVYPGAVAVAYFVGVVAAVTTPIPAELPGTALGSEYVFRAEVGLIVFGALYLPLLLVWNAYRGVTLRRIGTGAAGLEFRDTEDHAEAALDSVKSVRELLPEIIAFYDEKLAEAHAERDALKQDSAPDASNGDG